MAPPNSATSWLSIHEFDIVCNWLERSSREGALGSAGRAFRFWGRQLPEPERSAASPRGASAGARDL